MTKMHQAIFGHLARKFYEYKNFEVGILRLLSSIPILIVLIVTSSVNCFGAEPLSVNNSLDDNRIIQRVQLVGVIADTSAANAGIAVIKDTVTGRSYAIRTGESLPGVTHIVMTHVRRDGVEFTANSQRYTVRPYVSSTSGVESDNVANKDAQGTRDNMEVAEEDAGLFEKWASGSSDFASDALSLDTIKTLQKKFDELDQNDKKSGITRLNDSNSIDANAISDEGIEDEVIYEEDEPEDE